MSNEIIIKSPAPTLEAPKGNFVNFVFKDINKWRRKPAIECSESGVIYTYSELFDQIKQWSGFLKSFGLTSEDTVMIISPNCLQYVPIFFGTISLGIPVSLVKPNLTSNEMKQLISDIPTKFIIFSKEVEDTVYEALKEDILKFQFFYFGKPLKLDALNVDDILYGKEFIPSSSPPEVDGEKTALIIFSSGTTGTPKAVELSHNALSSLINYFTNPYHNITWKPEDLEQSVSMGIAPFSHSTGLFAVLTLELITGGKIVIFKKFSQQIFIGGIQKHKITRLFVPPSLLNLMIVSSNCTEETVESLDTVIYGSAPISKSSVEAFRRKFKSNIDLLEVYGMTECLCIMLTPRFCKNLFAGGRLLSNTESKIICTKTGKTLGPNQNGEICIKNDVVMKGYLNNQKATNEILKNGWIHTGDIGYYDEDEFFFVTDRIKDLIKVDCFQVSPSEVENELLKHPLVKECCVIGKPDPKYGELPFAFVTSKGKISEEELQNFLKDKLADYKQLKGGIKFVESPPKTESGKILRRELRKMI